jgi:hypothetical protein
MSLSLTFPLLRGGSWFNYPRHCRSAYRNHGNRDRPGLASNDIGLRVALPKAAPEPFPPSPQVVSLVTIAILDDGTISIQIPRQS